MATPTVGRPGSDIAGIMRAKYFLCNDTAAARLPCAARVRPTPNTLARRAATGPHKKHETILEFSKRPFVSLHPDVAGRLTLLFYYTRLRLFMDYASPRVLKG